MFVGASVPHDSMVFKKIKYINDSYIIYVEKLDWWVGVNRIIVCASICLAIEPVTLSDSVVKFVEMSKFAFFWNSLIM